MSEIEEGILAIRIRRGEQVWHVHGEQAGAEGVALAEGQVQGIYDSPRKSTYRGGPFTIGSKLKGTQRPHRDMVLGFHVYNTTNSYEFNDSAFRLAFDYEPDEYDPDRTPTLLEIDTNISGTRTIEVLMYEEPAFESAQDPIGHQYGNVLMKLRSAQPDWCSEDYTDEFSSTAQQASGTITVANPTNLDAYHRLVLTPGTWTIPDPSWIGKPGAREPGGPQGDRSVAGVKITAANGGAVVHWDRGNELMFRDLKGTNIQGQLGHRCFVNFFIPPRTPPTPLPISYVDAPAGGAMAKIVVPQRWSRPWGLEAVDASDWRPKLGTVRFMVPGSWSYEIPDDATHLDVILIGGGGGGGASNLFAEKGGGCARFFAATLVRGKDIPKDTGVLYGVVGAGGKGGKKETWAIRPGQDGQASTLQGIGVTTITAFGGKGSEMKDWVGEGVPPITFNGITYEGGGKQTDMSGAGRIPGGGGAAGFSFMSGADGGRGQVWIRAYKQ